MITLEWNKDEIYAEWQKIYLQFEGSVERAMKETERVVEEQTIPSVVQRSKAGDGTANESGYGYYRSKRHIRRRRRRGLQVGHKDLSYTDSMWQSLKIKKKTMWKTGFELQVGFTGKNPDRNKSNVNIANYQAEQIGKKILGMTPEESKTLQETIIKSLRNVK